MTGTGGGDDSALLREIAGSAWARPSLRYGAILLALFVGPGIGFQRGTHTRWQLVANDRSGLPPLIDMVSFSIATGGVLTLFIAPPANGSSVWVRHGWVSGAVFEHEITADLPANTQFRSPCLLLDTGTTAAAVARAGVYRETDFKGERF